VSCDGTKDLLCSEELLRAGRAVPWGSHSPRACPPGRRALRTVYPRTRCIR